MTTVGRIFIKSSQVVSKEYKQMGISLSKNEADKFSLNPLPKEILIQGEKPNREIFLIMEDNSQVLLGVEYPSLGFKRVTDIEFNFN